MLTDNPCNTFKREGTDRKDFTRAKSPSHPHRLPEVKLDVSERLRKGERGGERERRSKKVLTFSSILPNSHGESGSPTFCLSFVAL